MASVTPRVNPRSSGAPGRLLWEPEEHTELDEALDTLRRAAFTAAPATLTAAAVAATPPRRATVCCCCWRDTPLPSSSSSTETLPATSSSSRTVSVERQLLVLPGSEPRASVTYQGESQKVCSEDSILWVWWCQSIQV